MEKLKRLARIAARLWYSDRQIVLIDLLSRHLCVKEDELAFQMKANTHDVRKALARLKLDRLVKTELRPEIRGREGRLLNRIYYYIDYKVLCDVVKYKMWRIQTEFRSRSQTERTDRDYVCPQCKQRFTQLEATNYWHGDDMMFKCPYHRPGESYYLDLEPEKLSKSHELLNEFMTMAKPLIALLKEIETESIKVPLAYKPSSISKSLLAENVVTRERGEEVIATRLTASSVNYGYGSAPPAPVIIDKSTAVNVLTGAGNDSKGAAESEEMIQVEIKDQKSVTTTMNVEAEADKERKRIQNLMPSWHQKSTILKETTALSAASQQRHDDDDIMDEAPAIGDGEDLGDMMDYYQNYYAKLTTEPGAPAASGEKRKSIDDKTDDDQQEPSKSVKIYQTQELEEEEEEEFFEV